MRLQQKIARGMLAVLVVVVVFIFLTNKSYNDIEGFLVRDLPINFKIARQYERFAEYWSKVGESIKDHVKFGIDKNISYNEISENLEEYLLSIGELIVLTDDLPAYTEIKYKCMGYMSQIKALELLVNKRNRLQSKFSEKREIATENAKTEILHLLEQFKSMMQSWRETFSSADFKESLVGTSSLMDNISRIEKDLIVADSEMSVYLSIKKNSEHSEDTDKKKDDNKTTLSANRVERRLRAILSLVSKVISQSRLPIHKRVLTQIEIKIKSFYDAFIKLRNVIEVPELDFIETEDQINKTLTDATSVRQNAVSLAHARSEFFWRKIFAVSDQLINRASDNYHVMLSFLGLILAVSIYLVYEFPRSVSRPLEKLNHGVSEFQLGKNSLTLEQSGISEIDELSLAFNSMVRRLNVQGEINRRYLESIHSLTSIYRDLHEIEDRYDYPFERIENAITLVLQQLIEHCPKIDLAKAMVIYEEPETEKKYFMRIGNPEYSENFKNSEESLSYFKSTGYNPDDPDNSDPELMPLNKGLTGYYFEQFNDIRLGTESGPEFFIESYPLLPIPKNFHDNANVSLEKGEKLYESGLKGSLLTEKLKVPEKDPSIVQNARGLLFVYFMGENVKLSWQEIFFIQIIASQIASIIETDALLLEHDQKKMLDDQLNMAREIQENLLPRRVPNIDGLEISKINQPAAEVGGDYYDFFDLKDGKIRVVIADASGKNVPAAIIMTVFKTTLSTMDLAKMSAAEVLFRANNIIAKNITNDRFITAMYAIIDSITGQVELSSAGHNPAFVVPMNGNAIHAKNSKGLPLGIVEGFEYQTISFNLNDGDILWMYTDGVTEARNVSEEEFGEKKLKKFLVSYKGNNPTADLLSKLQEFSKLARQHDDITAVSVKFNKRNQ
ncbi:MAG: SpoIIE family protein phosphatase [Candidatus Riflebacteria bacterium]|nr:SpoIIE family protein phosphatase [Candidatus Riflebacteria bacterium]